VLRSWKKNKEKKTTLFGVVEIVSDMTFNLLPPSPSAYTAIVATFLDSKKQSLLYSYLFHGLGTSTAGTMTGCGGKLAQRQ
jgi:hypothetical protein